MASNNTAEFRLPNVVKFGFHDFKEINKHDSDMSKRKWSAKCNVCKVEIKETRGTTSRFTTEVAIYGP